VEPLIWLFTVIPGWEVDRNPMVGERPRFILKAVSTQIAVEYPRYADKPALVADVLTRIAGLQGLPTVIVLAAGSPLPVGRAGIR
jgi:hypothetical protein